MIYLICFLILLVVIDFIALFKQRQKLKATEEKYWDENRLHLDTQIKLEKAENQILELLNPPPQSEEAKEETEEQGNFVRLKRMKRATPETYRNLFDLDVNGQRVLEHLTMVFCKDAFVPDDKGGERETCYRLGSQSVINFIINNINQANNPNYKEQDND
ncbi:hypothetical protein APC42_10785 [Acinetobacter pittii]|uniref:Bbp19 family protein n=1 Tax=Acinetobacter pittii TaxID=48296 RepID=UPI00070C87BD|nr:hypothetical protein [Acinetobacter pittii]KRI47619.1 hypothetical protein APC42_10785 [Acinetobacter pittii]MCK0925485.1 hypothetical protein [Acinetobacter pittii]